MKVRAYVGVGLVGCDRREEIDIPDEDLEGLTGRDRESAIDEIVGEWKDNEIEWGWEEVR